MKTILAWSAGKDSTATGILAKLNNIHIDYIVTVMPDPFKGELELKEKFEDFMCMKVIMLDCPSYEDYFFRVKQRGDYKGTIYGFPFTAYKTCARVMKWEPMQKFAKENNNAKYLVGIAKGEARRVLLPNESLLIKYGYTEEMARNLCIEYGLLNPLYKHFKRLGCVRCPKQSIKALSIVKQLEPEKYDWMIRHDKLSPVQFKPNCTFCECDEKIKLMQMQQSLL